MVIWTTVLAVLLAVGWYVVGRFRGSTDDDRPSASELLTNFQDLHYKGDINAEEYRTIKTVLGAKLREELEDPEAQG